MEQVNGTLPRLERNERILDDHEKRLRDESALNATHAVLLAVTIEDIKEIKSDMKAARATIRSALITAGASIAVQVILFFVLTGGK